MLRRLDFQDEVLRGIALPTRRMSMTSKASRPRAEGEESQPTTRVRPAEIETDLKPTRASPDPPVKEDVVKTRVANQMKQPRLPRSFSVATSPTSKKAPESYSACHECIWNL